MSCPPRRIGDCEIALDDALTAARRAGEHRRVNAVLAGAPLAALWGPNPVPRAGGRCLDVVRLLRITTDSPAVEATSTRCQAVLEAFRGRAEAARRMIDSARRTVTELGLRHALLEVEQFAGIVELVVDDPAAAEPHLRQAYNGFRRMGLDADTAETAALLGRACLALGQEAEADELCTESERLAGHALKPAMAWRMLRAQLLSRQGDHDEARRQAEAAVALAERTDALVDHGDACLALATVLGTAGDVVGSRAAAERAVDLYERKGAAALAEEAHRLLGKHTVPPAPAPPEVPSVELHNAAVKASQQVMAAIDREAWDEFERLFAPEGSVESRRKVVGFKPTEFRADEVIGQTRRDLEAGIMRASLVDIAVRGERLALARMTLGTADVSPGAPQDEFLQVYGVDEEGRITLQVWFDLDDMDAAIAELDATHGRFEEEAHRQGRKLANAASQTSRRFLVHFAAGDQDAIAAMLADNFSTDDRRRVVGSGVLDGRDAAMASMRAIAEVFTTNATPTDIATRGRNLLLGRLSLSGRNEGPEAFLSEMLTVNEINDDEQLVAIVGFDLDDFDAAIAELDARYLAGEAAAHAHTWSVIVRAYESLARHELPATTPNWVNLDHRRGIAFAPGDLTAYLRNVWGEEYPSSFIETVHRLNSLGAIFVQVTKGTSREGFDAERRVVVLMTVEGELIDRAEIFDEADLDAAITKFEQLSRPARRLENAASRADEQTHAYFAARDWDGVTEILADDFYSDDRRPVVNAGIGRGRDVAIASLQAMADLEITFAAPCPIATRGGRLVLNRARWSWSDQRAEAFHTEALSVVEINADDRIAAYVWFDANDIDAALEELDARYLAGEAGAHADTWSAIMQAFTALNRHEPFGTTADWIYIDHRPVATFAADDLAAFLRATWELTPDINIAIEAVHRLSDVGTVLTHVAYGTSQEGFHAEWRMVLLATIEGDLINRVEIFDEADIDAALTQFDRLSQPARRLENAASRVADRFTAYYAAGDWQAMAEVLADNYSSDDRRRVVGSGVRHGRDAHIEDMRARAELWLTNRTSTVVATRGERLALMRISLSSRDQGHEAFVTELLIVDEINADERLVAGIAFDLNDFDAAVAELDARYVAGEAAAHRHTWSVITRGNTAANLHETLPTTPDCLTIDHRLRTTLDADGLTAYVRASWDLTPDFRSFIESVHRLTSLGAVVTHATYGTSEQGFDAEWRQITLLTVEGDLGNRCEIFDEADLDAALARFEELSQPARRLQNAASRVAERLWSCFAARDWIQIAETLAEGVVTVDHRRVVNGGVIRGRELQTASLRASSEAGVESFTSTVIATRGERLALACLRGSFRGLQGADVLDVFEVDADNRITAGALFDLDDFEAAIAELDARYLAGEAAAYAHTWTVFTQGIAALNRQELFATTPDWVNIDHRRGASFPPGEMPALLSTAWNRSSDLGNFIEAVHRLNDFGGVVTHVARETTQEGFHAEWRVISFITLEGDLVNRSEVFDETDLDAAITRFDELSRPSLKNAASQAYDRICQYLDARDWDAAAELSARNISVDDRRRVVNAGIRKGRDAAIEDLQAAAEVGFTLKMLSVIATRGARLALIRVRASGRDPEAIASEAPQIVEIDSDGRIAALVIFDLEDIDAAFAELDARYLAGEAAAHANTWSLVTGAYATLNRHELPQTMSDWVTTDHRVRETFDASDLTAYIRSAWDVTPDHKIYIEAVHRLSNHGAVVTHVAYGTSPEGFYAEWRMIGLLAVGGDQFNRCELFDEEDLDAALARFDELRLQPRRLENVAARVYEHFFACYASRDWAALATILTEDSYLEDRRRGVNAGRWDRRDVFIENFRATADFTLDNLGVIATRGERLLLGRFRSSPSDRASEMFYSEALCLDQIDTDERIQAIVIFDLEDIDAAFAELDARYLAGEAAAHAHTWSVIALASAAFNRRELPAADWVGIDHRRGTSFASSEMNANLRAFWDLTPDFSIHIEAVHRLSARGAVVTDVANGTSQAGFDAEWRMVNISTVDGDRISGVEIFDEADLDTALARFDELHLQPHRLENAASRVGDRFQRQYAARNWDAIADMLADDYFSDDRRRVVGAGVRHGRDAQMADLRVIADVWITNVMPTVIATRGERLFLMRTGYAGGDRGSEAFRTEVFVVEEINADERIVASIAFDLNDIDAAFAELDARYLAGEAAAHAHTWSVITSIYAAFNQRELTGAEWVIVDHRRGTPFASSNLTASLRALWDLTPDLSIHIEAVHRLSSFGAVVTHVMKGTSRDGFDAEWRAIDLLTVEGDLINRTEMFDEADLDAAISRFDQLSRPALRNAASQAYEGLCQYLEARDWDAVAELCAENVSVDDRMRVVNAGIRTGRNAAIEDLQATAEVGFTCKFLSVIATREDRLALTRVRAVGRDPEAIANDVLNIVEVDSDGRIAADVIFDLEDVDAAFAELEARYLADEAAAHSRTWSVIVETYAAFNRHEFSGRDFDIMDHRRGALFTSSNLSAYIRASRDLTPNLSIHVEAVHRLSNFGAVVTDRAHDTSPEGFDAEWRMIQLLIVEGDRIDRCEIFDETDVDAALARFEELQPQARRLENAASQAESRFGSYFAARNWDALAELIADDFSMDDRRHVINAGVTHGRDAEIASQRAIADVGVKSMTQTVIATRGGRLALGRYFVSDSWGGTEALCVSEINGENQIVARVGFDADDLDAAFEELDARYLAGEAAAHARTWSVIARASVAFNRHEFPPATPDSVFIDHRPLVTMEAVDLAASLRAAWDLTPDISICIEAVHRLSELGAVVTHALKGTSPEGFEADWRMVEVFTVEGDLISRCEQFDETDLDAALARFDELHFQPRQLENAATQLIERYQACFSVGDWTDMAELLADDMVIDDRRRVGNAGVRLGRNVHIADMRATVEVGVESITSSAIATRGKRLALVRQRYRFSGLAPDEFGAEMLSIAEIDVDNRIAAGVAFDIADIDRAFEELDARYLAGEAAAHADTWSVMMQACAALNRREIFATTADFVDIDHRSLAAVGPGDLKAYIRAALNDGAYNVYIEAVHRLSDLGAVVTLVSSGTSQEGFDGEWRMADIFTVEGDLISRCEIFDEADLDTALARFDELQPQASRPENAASPSG